MSAAARYWRDTISDDDDIRSEYDSSFEESDDDHREVMLSESNIHAGDAVGTGENLNEYIKQRLTSCKQILKELHEFYLRIGGLRVEDDDFWNKSKLVETKPVIEEYYAIEKKCLEFAMSQLNDPYNGQCIMHLDDVFKTIRRMIDKLNAIVKIKWLV